MINESLYLEADLCLSSVLLGSSSIGDGRLYLIVAIGSFIGIGTLRRRRKGILGILASIFITNCYRNFNLVVNLLGCSLLINFYCKCKVSI